MTGRFTSRIGSSQGWRLKLTIAALCLSCMPADAAGGEFALRDGDTVAFLGDSITAAGTYGKLIENYTLLRFPRRQVRFINAGIGGDTAAGGLKRLDRDVFSHDATVLIVAYGVNDIGWGLRADEAHRQTYLDAIDQIVTRCRDRGVRVYVCSAAITAADPDKSEDDFLQQMCDAGLEIAARLGAETIDVQRGMREIQRKVWAANQSQPKKKKTTLHATDGVHLNQLGHIAMGFVILKGLGAPADVSTASIQMDRPADVRTEGCTVDDIVKQHDGLAFTRLDEGLPLNFGLFFGLNFRFVPIPEQLNRYMLTVADLPRGRYDVLVDGRKITTVTARRLAAGVNISSSTPSAWQPGSPWAAQAQVLRSLTEARHQVAVATKIAQGYLAGSEMPAELARQTVDVNHRIERLQRTAAAPRPYRFVIRRIAPPQAGQ